MCQMNINDIPETVKVAVDSSAATAVGFAYFEVLPTILSMASTSLAIIWFGIQIWYFIYSHIKKKKAKSRSKK